MTRQRRLELRATNEFFGAARPNFDAAGVIVRGTPRQIQEAMADFRRVSSGCDVAFQITDLRTGHSIDRMDFAAEIAAADAERN